MIMTDLGSTQAKNLPGSIASDALLKLIALKGFALARGYEVPDAFINEIAALQRFIQNQSSSEFSAEDSVKVDRLTRDLSQITYPINAENVHRIIEGDGITKFAYKLLAAGFAAALLSGLLIGAIRAGGEWAEYAKAFLAICLGVVGAIVYVMLPNGRLNVVAGLDNESIATNVIRVTTGGLLGFVIYIANPAFLDIKTGSAAYGLLAPLVAGYSITLAVGILAKAVTAVELTLNLDEKKTHAALKK
jgi:hypothetical protein